MQAAFRLPQPRRIQPRDGDVAATLGRLGGESDEAVLLAAALATLEITWIYNEFFWATVLLQNGELFPITSSLTNLSGAFFTDNNLVAAGSLIVAVPTLAIYFALQKQFVSGLTLGSDKG